MNREALNRMEEKVEVNNRRKFVVLEGVQMHKEVTYEDFCSEALPHMLSIRRVAGRLTRDSDDAEDLAQDTLLEAWRSFGKYTLGTNCRAWMMKILINKFRQYRKKAFRSMKVFRAVDEFVLQSATAHKSVKEELTNKEIIRTLGNIPDINSELILMVDVHEFSYREAAGALDIPIGTVMSRLSRGRRLMRRAVASRFGKQESDEVRFSDDVLRHFV